MVEYVAAQVLTGAPISAKKFDAQVYPSDIEVSATKGVEIKWSLESDNNSPDDLSGKSLFKQLDTNSSGTLDAEEYKKVSSPLPYDEADLNSDGVVDKLEFEQAINRIREFEDSKGDNYPHQKY